MKKQKGLLKSGKLEKKMASDSTKVRDGGIRERKNKKNKRTCQFCRQWRNVDCHKSIFTMVHIMHHNGAHYAYSSAASNLPNRWGRLSSKRARWRFENAGQKAVWSSNCRKPKRSKSPQAAKSNFVRKNCLFDTVSTRNNQLMHSKKKDEGLTRHFVPNNCAEKVIKFVTDFLPSGNKTKICTIVSKC